MFQSSLDVSLGTRDESMQDELRLTHVSIVLGRLSWYSHSARHYGRVLEVCVSIVLGRLSWYSLVRRTVMSLNRKKFQSSLDVSLGTRAEDRPCRAERCRVSIVLGRLSWYSHGNNGAAGLLESRVSIVLGRLSWYSQPRFQAA